MCPPCHLSSFKAHSARSYFSRSVVPVQDKNKSDLLTQIYYSTNIINEDSIGCTDAILIDNICALYQYSRLVQLLNLFVAHVQQRFEDVLRVRAQQGSGTVNVAGRLRHFERHAWIELLAHHRMIECFHEAARPDMLVVDKLARAENRARRHARPLQAIHDIVMVKLRRPLAYELIQRSTILDARRVGAITRVLRQRGLPDGLRQRRELGIVLNREGAPP